MAINNPHRYYDKGMDDAYMGSDRSNKSLSYSRGYDYGSYLLKLEEDEQEKKRMDKQQSEQSNQTND